MKVTVIGCWGGYPRVDAATSGYLVESNGTKVLLDVGSAVVSKIQKYTELSTLHHTIISHNHHDHVSDLGALLYTRLIQTYTSAHSLNEVLNIYAPNDPNLKETVENVKFCKFHNYTDEDTIKIGDLTFTFLRTDHNVETYACRITDGTYDVVYTADTAYFDGLIDFSKNANLLIAECSMFEGEDAKRLKHMNANEVGKLAKHANVDSLWLTHLPHYGNIGNLKATVEKEVSIPVIRAYEGLAYYDNIMM